MPIDLSVEKLTAAADFAAKYPTVFAQRIDRGAETLETLARISDQRSPDKMPKAEREEYIARIYFS